MQFTELGLFYLMSFPLLIFTITPILSLFFGLHPFISSNLDYILHFWPYAAVIEILLALLADTTRFEDLWRARQMWFGMLFVYSKAAYLVITYGPSKKPVYKVTRKVQQTGLYVRETLLQILLFLLLLSAIFYNMLAHHNVLKDGDLGSMFWVLLYLLLLSGIIRRSWFGVKITLPERLLVKGHSLHQQETLQGEVLSVQQNMVRLRVRSRELWQFLRFALVGTLNAVINFGVFNVLLWLAPTHNNWQLLGYNSLAVLLAATNSFFCNKYWTFQQHQRISGQEVLRFCILAVSTILLNDVLIWQLSTYFPIWIQTIYGSNALKLGAILGTTSLSFFGMRIWVFLKRT